MCGVFGTRGASFEKHGAESSGRKSEKDEKTAREKDQELDGLVHEVCYADHGSCHKQEIRGLLLL